MKKLLVLCFGLLLAGMLVRSIVNGENPRPGDDKVRVSGGKMEGKEYIFNWQFCQKEKWTPTNNMPQASMALLEVHGVNAYDAVNHVIKLKGHYHMLFSNDKHEIVATSMRHGASTEWCNMSSNECDKKLTSEAVIFVKIKTSDNSDPVTMNNDVATVNLTNVKDVFFAPKPSGDGCTE